MSVIVELTLPADAFELGRVLSIEGSTQVSLETMVPLGERSIPFFRLHSDAAESFEKRVRAHRSVEDIHAVNTHGEETLYALDWRMGDDEFLTGVSAMDGHVLEATGSAQHWAFGLRFPDHEALSAFQTHCVEADLGIDVTRVYNPTRPDAGPWYGLTPTQRETLVRAVEAGYYSIPRQVPTQQLASEFGVSDQAVTERLRRAITTLATNTLLLEAESS